MSCCPFAWLVHALTAVDSCQPVAGEICFCFHPNRTADGVMGTRRHSFRFNKLYLRLFIQCSTNSQIKSKIQRFLINKKENNNI